MQCPETGWLEERVVLHFVMSGQEGKVCFSSLAMYFLEYEAVLEGLKELLPMP